MKFFKIWTEGFLVYIIIIQLFLECGKSGKGLLKDDPFTAMSALCFEPLRSKSKAQFTNYVTRTPKMHHTYLKELVNEC